MIQKLIEILRVQSIVRGREVSVRREYWFVPKLVPRMMSVDVLGLVSGLLRTCFFSGKRLQFPRQLW